MQDLSSLAKTLQSYLGMVDMMTSRSSGASNGMGLLVVKLDQLKVKIYQESGHSLPHLHIDYGKIAHAASYGIDPVTRLVGQLDRKYDQTIIRWVQTNQTALLALWAEVQAGNSTDALVAELKGNA